MSIYRRHKLVERLGARRRGHCHKWRRGLRGVRCDAEVQRRAALRARLVPARFARLGAVIVSTCIVHVHPGAQAHIHPPPTGTAVRARRRWRSLEGEGSGRCRFTRHANEVPEAPQPRSGVNGRLCRPQVRCAPNSGSGDAPVCASFVAGLPLSTDPHRAKWRDAGRRQAWATRRFWPRLAAAAWDCSISVSNDTVGGARPSSGVPPPMWRCHHLSSLVGGQSALRAHDLEWPL